MQSVANNNVAAVKSAVDILDVIGSYLELQSGGSNRYKALCPFHREKTPSFTVNRERQTYYCFGCERGGDVITFVQEIDGLTFPEALEALADRAGITLERRGGGGGESGDARRQLLRFSEFAAGFYQERLSSPLGGGPGREYIKGRGLSPATVSRFGLGYAPDDWQALTAASRASRDSFSEKTMLASGLVRTGERGLYDFFRNRVVFPIKDTSGRTVALGGRALDDQPAKYINSPENAVYKKGSTLYGLYEAKDAVRQAGMAILVEGYFDVLRCVDAGIENVIATCGTALTPQQAGLIRRYAPGAVVVYDGDPAGIRAALRSIGILVGAGLTVRAVALPGGKDPDDFIASEGSERFRELVEEAPAFIPFYVRTSAGRTETIEGRTEVARELFEVVQSVDDGMRRDEYLKEVATELGLDVFRCRQEFQRFQSGRGRARERAGHAPAETVEKFDVNDRQFLTAALAWPGGLERCRAEIELLERVRPTLSAAIAVALNPESPVDDAAGKRLYANATNVEMPAGIDAEAFVDSCLRGFRRQGLTLERDRIQEEIRHFERLDNGSALEDLVSRKLELDREIERLHVA